MVAAMANVLPRDKQRAAIHCLVEGNSIRSTERLLGIHRDTIMRLGARVGTGCANLLDERMRNLACKRLEIDELWAFVSKKQRHVTEVDDAHCVGDAWTFVAIEAETKLVPSFLVGKRDAESTRVFIEDLAARLVNRVQITTDGLRTYVEPIGDAFASVGVDYATLIKTYEAEPMGPGRYSPPKVTGTEKTPIYGAPVAELVSTSFVERQNLNIRMGIRRYTRLTNAFSKKLSNHVAWTAMWLAFYDFVRVHRTLRVTPAMAAGLESKLWALDDLIDEALSRTKESA